jgi:hypothetical protein
MLKKESFARQTSLSPFICSHVQVLAPMTHVLEVGSITHRYSIWKLVIHSQKYTPAVTVVRTIPCQRLLPPKAGSAT